MSVVVERGFARCPRCVAVADYTFAESGPNVVRYEVTCKRCGECYSEVHSAASPDFRTAVEAVSSPLPEVARPVGPRGSRMLARLAEARSRAGRRWPQQWRRGSHPGSDST